MVSQVRTRSFPDCNFCHQGLQRQVADLEARHKVAKESQAAAEGEVERLSAALKDAQVGYRYCLRLGCNCVRLIAVLRSPLSTSPPSLYQPLPHYSWTWSSYPDRTGSIGIGIAADGRVSIVLPSLRMYPGLPAALPLRTERLEWHRREAGE